MEDNSWDAIPTLSLPLGVSVPMSLLFLVLLVIAARKLRDPASIFVLCAAWLRYIVSTFHHFTYVDLVAGLSINALVSIGLFFVGMIIVRPRDFRLKALAPLYLLLAVALGSAIMNVAIGGLITVITKFGYLTVVMLCTLQAFRTHGDRLFTYLLLVFLPPFAFQWISVILHIPRSLDPDGGQSYIGGYNHEAGFSVVLSTALLAPCLARKMWLPLRAGALMAAIIGLSLANYRTAILAFAPFLIVSLARPIALLMPAQRAALGLAGAVLLTIGGIAASEKVADRFADLASVGDVAGYIVQSPDDLSKDKRDLFSARVYLWSRYIEAWREGPPHYRMIGAGPEARIPTKDKYPHNTLVSALYEYGLLGVAAYLFLFGAMLAISFRAAAGERAGLVSGHLSFFILNMATMPLWQIEGNILYGLLCGYTLYSVQRARSGLRTQSAAPTAWPALGYAGTTGG